MNYTTIKEIIEEFDLEHSEISDVRKELKALLKLVHPDNNGGKGFKDKVAKLTYNKLMSAIKFIDEQILTITKNELATIVKDLVPVNDNKEEYLKLARQIKYEIRNLKKSNLLPRISTSAVAIVISFIWLFPSTVLEHPVLSKIIEPTSQLFTIIWICSLIIVGLVWLVAKRKEKIMKEALNKLNLEMIQNNIFLKSIRGKIYSAEKEKIDYITFSKDDIIDFFSRLEIRGFNETYRWMKRKPLQRINKLFKSIFGIEQQIDIEMAHSLADVILNRLLSRNKISIVEDEGLSTTYRMEIKTTGNNVS